MPECVHCFAPVRQHGTACQQCRLERQFGDGRDNYKEGWPGLQPPAKEAGD